MPSPRCRVKNVRNRYSVYLALLLLAAFAAGCQYRMGQGDNCCPYSTVSIPYVDGDVDGDLTAELIKTLASSGTLRYCPSGGQLVLKVKVQEADDDNIGFRYDRKGDGRRKKTIIPTETRIKAVAEVILMEEGSGKIIRGPVLVHASVDFDHDYYTSRHEENIFSLGQLSDIDAARTAVRQPLNRVLAGKIVDMINQSWF